MKKAIYMLLIATAIYFVACGRILTVYYRVIDAEGKPVTGVELYAGRDTGGGWTHKKKKLTDQNGICAYKGFFLSNTYVDVSAVFTKEGYYTTYAPRADYPRVRKGFWGNADHSMVVTLKRIKKPIPMYYKRTNTILPSNRGSFGYDLVVGDLVTPYGTGESSDLVFQVAPNDNRKTVQDRAVIFDITFSNSSDGIQPIFIQDRVIDNQHYEALAPKFDYNAPTTGYHSSLSSADNGWEDKYDQESRRTGIVRNWSEEVNYYIKVRSNKDGTAMYGWVRGFFRVEDYNTPHVQFEYAVNPERTTNIEFQKRLPIKLFRYEY